MKREDYEQLGTLERAIYDYMEKAFRENDYTIELDEPMFKPDGYVTATLTFGGYAIRASLNEKRYVCWHCDRTMERLIKAIPHIEVKLVAQAKRIIKEMEPELRQKRIKELQDEINRLKIA